MTAETIEHLYQVEVAIEKAKSLLTKLKFPDDLRAVIVAATIDQLIEHNAVALSG